MSGNLSTCIVAAIRSVVGPGPVALHEPTFSGNELAYLKECIETTHVASKGRFIDQFEEDLSEYTGARFVVSMASGTAALHIALRVAGVSVGDEVLLPALTFVATANAVTYCGATPHFVDCEEQTLGIDTCRLKAYLQSSCEKQSGLTINRRTGRIIRALVPVHTFGHPSDLDGLMSIASEFNLVLIEDAAESIGSFYGGRHTGTFGRAGILSFNGNKTITTGGGGAILTDCSELAREARHLSRAARVKHPWEYVHDDVGYNYRLPNMNAALGCAQIEQLPGLIDAKRRLYGKYLAAFQQIKEVELISEPPNARSNYWLQAIRLRSGAIEKFDEILEKGNDAGYQLRPIWTPLHQLIHFKNCPRALLSTAERLGRSIINLPSMLKP
jgi:aminotransferase in exopolysaccharide biosynthesis